jgi:imidazolonepropionase-like amidohydrolase
MRRATWLLTIGLLLPGTALAADMALVGGTVLTITQGTLENATVLCRNGRIVAVGANIEVPEGVRQLDVAGRFVTPGIIDTHSHMGVYPWTTAKGNADGNEATAPTTPDVRAEDAVFLEDPAFERARAGGVTTILVIPGSANLIGGEGIVLKLRRGNTLDALRFVGAPRQMKMAMGENPKRVYGGRTERPSTRMGNLAYLRDVFTRAQRYQGRWRAFHAQTFASPSDRAEAEPKYDSQLEVLADVLAGEVRLQVHCYTKSDILSLLRLAEHFGIQIAAIHHAVEAYKVAPLLAARGIGVCTWADWWGFKQEAWDAIPENVALCAKAGVTVSIHSDSANSIQRLYHEAAKTVRAGMPRDRALEAITLGPARILGIADRVGSIEVGKDADLAVFSKHPLDMYTRVDWTILDGEVVYERPRPVSHPPLERGASVVLRGGRVHPIASPPVENGVVVIRDGRIAAVGGPETRIPADIPTVDVTGHEVYPGLIDAGTSVGLVEIGSDARLRETDAVSGLMVPHLRVTDGLNPESETIRVGRMTGVTTCLISPGEANLVAGLAAVIDLDGDTVEAMVVRDPAALCVNLGLAGRRKNEAETRMEQVAALRQLLTEAQAYADKLERHAAELSLHEDKVARWKARAKKREGETGDEDEQPGLPPAPPERRLDLEALLPALRGELPVLMRVHEQRDIRQALALAKEFGLRPILRGATEAYRVADLLRAGDVPVVLGPVTTQPSGFETRGAIYENAALCSKAGVRFALQTASTHGVRRLPYEAGLAVTYGLPHDAAIRAITLDAARVLGIDRDYGSLEVGKVANVIVTTGDPLQPLTQLEHMYIRGRAVDLTSRQTRLRDRFDPEGR